MSLKKKLRSWAHAHQEFGHNIFLLSKVATLMVANLLFIAGHVYFFVGAGFMERAILHVVGASIFFTGSMLAMGDIVWRREATLHTQLRLPILEQVMFLSGGIFINAALFFVISSVVLLSDFMPPNVASDSLAIVAGGSLFMSYVLQLLITVHNTVSTRRESMPWSARVSQLVNIAGDMQLCSAGILIAVSHGLVIGNTLIVGNGIGIAGRSLLIIGQTYKLTYEYGLVTRATNLMSKTSSSASSAS